jgi:hypothetical protein
MISANADELIKSLDSYKVEVERKLKHMVVKFAQDVATAASIETAIGDESRLHNMYLERQRARGIDPHPGFHKGAWVYTEGSLTFDPTIHSRQDMLSNVQSAANAEYKIGDSFIVGAEGTAYAFLERRDGIVHDAMKAVQEVYQSNLERHYNEG